MKKCGVCKKIVIQTDTHHILPRALGGGDEESNKMELCKSCHLKHDRWITNFIA
jgi:5-methylcytosine-specific restriction endonuclease McrA